MGKKYEFVSILCVCLLACSATGCGEAKEISDQVQGVLDQEDEHVLAVKNGYPVSIPSITYAEAFDNFFRNPTWKYFDGENGEQVVEFTGYCTYHDVEVKARMQFLLSEDGKSFEQGALSFNDVPQVTLVANAMVYKAFEEYASQNNIDIEEDAPVWESPDEDSNEYMTVNADESVDVSTDEVAENNTLTESDIRINGEETTTENYASQEGNLEFSLNLVDDMAYYSELDNIGYGYCLSFTLNGEEILFDVITASNRYERSGFAEPIDSNKVRCYMENHKNNYFDVIWDETQEMIHIEYKNKSDYMHSSLNGLDLWLMDDASWWFMEEESNEEESEYIFPYSDCSYLTEADVSGVSSDILRVARNEIYARHGRIFESEDLKEYFNSKSWYTGLYTVAEFKESWLNEYERANIELIRAYE